MGSRTTHSATTVRGVIMKPWSGLGGQIIAVIKDQALRKRLAADGPIGDFYRAGDNILLYVELPLGQDDLVIDAGGYKGN